MKTQAQLDKATDQRLRKTYGKGLDWYEEELQSIGGGCSICHKPPGTRRLHVDHDHSWKKVKILSFKEETPYLGSWAASGLYNGVEYTGYGKTKSLALKMVRDKLKAASVRGLLCYTHNAGLQKFQDDPKLLRAAADYLERHQGVET